METACEVGRTPVVQATPSGASPGLSYGAGLLGNWGRHSTN